MKIDVKKLREDFPSLKVVGNPNSFFERLSDLDSLENQSLVWLKNHDTEKLNRILNSGVGVAVLPSNFKDETLVNSDIAFVISDSPKLTFIKLVQMYFHKPEPIGVHHSATISEKAEIGNSCRIGPNAVIGNARLGQNVTIGANCVINDDVIIGNNVEISPNSTIGGDGFGYEKDKNGNYFKFPHLGGVVIEDDVNIGANTAIDRGTLGNTVIKRGVKIDNLVHIAHNVQIGENSMIIANSMIAGSVNIGRNVWVAPSASILNQLRIENDSVIGMGAVVVKPVTEKQIVAGSPARDLKIFQKIQKVLKGFINED